jgi:TetR/AcrR family transcriptional regulator, transcriptional repressor for nem operon
MTKGDETRERIVVEAASLFNQYGYAGGSLAALMAATGLEKGGIYRHFSSKEEIAAEAFDYAWEAAWDTRSRDLDSIPDSVDRLRQFVANFVELRPPLPGGCPLLNTAVDSDDGNPMLRKRVRKAMRHWKSYLTSIVATGIDEFEIQKRVAPDDLGTLIISSLEGALMVGRIEGNRKALQTIQKHLDKVLEEVRLA